MASHGSRPTCKAARALVAILCLAAAACAQSFFNTRGLGEVSLPAEAENAGFGSPAALSWQNPGAHIQLDKVSFVGSALGAAAVGRQAGQSRLLYDVRPAGMCIAVPLPHGTRFVFGADERFNQDFDLWAGPGQDTSYRYHITGRGGIYALRAGLGWSFLKTGALGLEYSRLLGASRELWALNLGGSNVLTDTVELDYAGNLLRAGASVQTGPVRLGLHYSLAHGLSARSLRRVHGVITDSVRTYAIGVPGAAAFGAGYGISEQTRIALGLEYRPWSGMTVDTATMPGAQNSLRGSFGIEHIFGRLPVRAGYFAEQGYFLARDSSAVFAHGLSLGTGIPITGFGSLDLSGQFAYRSSATLGEYTARLMLSLAYSEAWLRRTRRWGY